MKIRTITCHDVNNYGASLQALALQTYLASLGLWTESTRCVTRIYF